MKDNIILQTRGLKKYYGKGETLVKALDGIDLDIRKIYGHYRNLRLRKIHAASYAGRPGYPERRQRPGGRYGACSLKQRTGHHFPP